jgi:DNA-binding NarL/FixJ family response regulator
LIADDDALVREMLRKTIEEDSEIVGEASNGLEAVAAAERLRPDVVLLDISMPVMGGFEAARRLRELLPDLLIVFVSQYAETAYADEAFSSGARGYVLKRGLIGEIRDAIREVLAGRLFRSPLLVG